MASKARARKHEANKLRSAAPASSTSVSSLYNNPQLEDLTVRLEQRVSDLEKAEHVSSVHRGRDHGRGGGGDKRPRSQSGNAGRDTHKPKAQYKSGNSNDRAGKPNRKRVDEPCDFDGCKYTKNRFTHSRADCRIEERAISEGYKVSKE